MPRTAISNAQVDDVYSLLELVYCNSTVSQGLPHIGYPAIVSWKRLTVFDAHAHDVLITVS